MVPPTDARPAEPESALPSVTARVLAFALDLHRRRGRGLIGYAFADMGEFGGAWTGLVTLIAILVGAGGSPWSPC